MRRLKTYPALASVALPRSAVILAVHDRPGPESPALLVSYDDADEEKVERRFATLRTGDALPPGAQFVASWRRHPADGGIAALFELGEDIPADLPPEMHEHYRTLIRDGFRVVIVGGDAVRCWQAPDDIPPGQLSREQLIAIASLQEHGFGSVVNA